MLLFVAAKAFPFCIFPTDSVRVLSGSHSEQPF